MIDSVAANKQGILDERDQRVLVVDHLPFYFSIHLNEPCNQRCIMCVPTGNHGSRVLPFESFVELFDEVRPFAEHITLIGGEPLMYPHIGEVLELLAEHPITVTINTNATMLNDRLDRLLLGLHELNLKWSIDAVTASTYRRIRGRDHFARVSARLRHFADLARDRPNIHLIPVYVVMAENLHEVVPFVEYAAALAPYRIEFHPVRHVSSWSVENGTGWTFEGSEQVCEAFPAEFNDTMQAAAASCAARGIDCEIHAL
jgi:molybdenum cofactor biosynthesis enzyme MoaA